MPLRPVPLRPVPLRRPASLRRPAVALAATGLALVMPLLGAPAASAHHGFTGEYDRTAPLYVGGTVTRATYGFPHGLVELAPRPGATVPADLLALPDDAYQRLGGRQVVTGARPADLPAGDSVTLVLPPPMTTAVAGLGTRPERGDEVGAVVFRECSGGELRVQLLRISATEAVPRSGVVQTEVDGCDDHGSGAAGGTPSGTTAAGGTGPTTAAADGGPGALAVAGVLLTLVVVGGTAVAVVRARRG